MAALLILTATSSSAQTARELMQQGWLELVKDNDTSALQYFSQAYTLAERSGKKEDIAQALVYLGICQYSVSNALGLSYATRAMSVYRQLEQSDPAKALEGRSRCLQLISVIKARQGDIIASIRLSREALQGFSENGDTTGYLGLIYGSLGRAYQRLHQDDSARFFYGLSLAEHERTHNLTYLPGALINSGTVAQESGDQERSFSFYSRALQLADSTGNRQAKVLALVALGRWSVVFGRFAATEQYLHQAREIASGLTDPVYLLKAQQAFADWYRQNRRYQEALNCMDAIQAITDTLHELDRRKELRKLEIEFDLTEKDRKLSLVQKEKEIAVLTNSVLWGGIISLVLLSAGVIFILRRNHKRDRALLQTTEALMESQREQSRLLAAQKELEEQQLANELEHKESQLSALTIQMLQKNELLQELQQKLQERKADTQDPAIEKILAKGLNQDREWADFNVYFESVNKHFFTRIKSAYPDISTNDLKMCALIKLNLSIKEMASILNISPDSVKTARYRLRKKLKLNTEDNLNEFILGL